MAKGACCVFICYVYLEIIYLEITISAPPRPLPFPPSSYETKHSRKDHVKFVEDNLSIIWRDMVCLSLQIF